ncbi:MAG: acyl-CoA thioesterase [Fibrobacterales bacterium]
MSDQNHKATIRFLAQPTDVNFGGNVHGGTAMKWLDQAGYVCAAGWSQKYCVTAFVGDINFSSPIKVGSLVEVTARVIYTGNSTMHISVAIKSCDPQKCDMTHAIRCLMVFVAVDEKGKPVPVPKWTPAGEKEIALANYAKRIIDARKINSEELAKLYN